MYRFIVWSILLRMWRRFPPPKPASCKKARASQRWPFSKELLQPQHLYFDFEERTRNNFHIKMSSRGATRRYSRSRSRSPRYSRRYSRSRSRSYSPQRGGGSSGGRYGGGGGAGPSRSRRSHR